MEGVFAFLSWISFLLGFSMKIKGEGVGEENGFEGFTWEMMSGANLGDQTEP